MYALLFINNDLICNLLKPFEDILISVNMYLIKMRNCCLCTMYVYAVSWHSEDYRIHVNIEIFTNCTYELRINKYEI